MATESILNTDILIRVIELAFDFFGSEILRKLIFCPPRVGICVNVSPQGWGFCCINESLLHSSTSRDRIFLIVMMLVVTNIIT